MIRKMPGLRIFNGVYMKYKETLLYLFFGGLTTVVSILLFALFNVFFQINALIENIVSWIISVAFAFLTNRICFFSAPTHTISEFITQMVNFYGGRVVTLFIEEGILFVFITYLGFNTMIVKIVAQIIVIILNYIISKLWVFKN